jgi:ATP-dependent Clp protease ATP-binding subunit ClpC
LARDGLRQRGILPELPADTVERLANVGFDAAFGARALKRHIERELVVPLSETLAANPQASQLILVERRVRATLSARPAGTGAALANAARGLRQRCARV